MITELDDKKSCYQLIITIAISEKTNTPRTNISSGDGVHNDLEYLRWNAFIFQFDQFLVRFFPISKYGAEIIAIRRKNNSVSWEKCITQF